MLSVIVPVYDVEAYLDDCLRSIREQRHRSIEIVVVDDGTPDRSMMIARRHAKRDDRISIVERDNGGLSAARNTGVAAASGEFLTFVDSDDLVTTDGFAAAMASLAVTGSDIAVLQYGRLRDGRPAKAAAWIRRLHAAERRAVTLESCPDVMVNATAWGKVFRRDFYDRSGLHFVEGVLYEDQAFTAEAYARAGGIDVLRETGYLWRVNEASLSQGQVTVANLLGRLDAARDSLAVLADHPARAERALQQLRFNLPNSLLKLERADDAYLDALVQRVPAIVAEAPPDRYAKEVPAQYRVLYALLAAGDRDAVWRYVRAEGMQPEVHPSGMEPAGLTTYLPGWQRDPAPPEAYVLTAEQTALRAKVRAVHADGPNLVLQVVAWFPNVELADPALTVKTDGDLVDIVQWGEPHVVTSRQGAQRRYARSSWSVTLRDAARRAPREITLTLEDGDRRGTTTARVPG